MHNPCIQCTNNIILTEYFSLATLSFGVLNSFHVPAYFFQELYCKEVIGYIPCAVRETTITVSHFSSVGTYLTVLYNLVVVVITTNHTHSFSRQHLLDNLYVCGVKER